MISAVERGRVSELLAEFDARVPARVRNKLRYRHSIRGNSVTLFECRPKWNDPTVWLKSPQAKFRRNASTGLWSLFWRDRNARWHLYEGLPPTQDIERLVAEVGRDPTHVFSG